MFWKKPRKQEKSRKRFTGEELEKIREMLEKNMKVTEIAKELGRTERSIYNITYKQKLRIRLKESLSKLVEEEKELSKRVEDLHKTVSELESRERELIKQVKALEESKKALEYFRTKGKEELKRFMEAHANEIAVLKIGEWLRALGIRF